MIGRIASFVNLAGPDLIVIMIIIAVLAGIPTAIALAIVFIINRRSKKPPPLPPVVRHPSSASPPTTPERGAWHHAVNVWAPNHLTKTLQPTGSSPRPVRPKLADRLVSSRFYD